MWCRVLAFRYLCCVHVNAAPLLAQLDVVPELHRPGDVVELPPRQRVPELVCAVFPEQDVLNESHETVGEVLYVELKREDGHKWEKD